MHPVFQQEIVRHRIHDLRDAGGGRPRRRSFRKTLGLAIVRLGLRLAG